MIHAVIYGLIFVLLYFSSWSSGFLLGNFFYSGSGFSESLTKLSYYSGELLLYISLSYCILQLLQRQGISYTSKKAIILLVVSLLFMSSLNINGVILSCVLLLCGFANSNRVIQGLGAISLLFFMSQYYYFLETSLIAKSKHLLMVGISLLVIRWLAIFFLKNKKVRTPKNLVESGV